MRTILLAVTILAFVTLSTTANAAIIYSGALPTDTGTSIDGTSSGLFGIVDTGFNPATQAIFEIPLSAAVVGSTFLYNSGITFDKAVALLTSGLDGYIAVVVGGSGLTVLQSEFFASVSLNGIDLAGFSIDSIEWTIDSYIIDRNANMATVESSLTVNGTGPSQVATPSAFTLFGLGLIGLAFATRLKR